MDRFYRKAPGWRQTLALALVLCAGLADADEAVTDQGRRFLGTLRKKTFLVANTERTLSLEHIRSVRFADHPAPLPRCRLLHQLLLPGDQQLSGELLALGLKEIQFRIPSGKSITLPRRDVQGIVAADSNLVQLVEDFEGKISAAAWLGKPVFSPEHAFAGKTSLLVNSSSRDLGLVISTPQKPKTACRATLHFFDPGLKENAGAKIHFVFQAQQASAPIILLLAGDYYGRDNASGYRLKASPGWHVLQMDWKGGETRAFIDDLLITTQTIPEDARLASLRFSFAGQGEMWFDAFHLTENASPAKRTPGPPELDEIWLASGDQVFGDLLQADDRGIVLQARFGKRVFPWSNVRGLFFRSDAKPRPESRTVVRFRSGPGVSADQLTGASIDLNERRLLLRHDVLGEVEIERTRLERIRFAEPAAK